MSSKDLRAECIEARDKLVERVQFSQFAGGLGSEVKKFVIFTDGYLKDMDKFHARAEKMCGKVLADDAVNKGFLERFKESVDFANKIIESRVLPSPDKYDPTSKVEIAGVSEFREDGEKAIKHVLQSTQDILKAYQELAFFSEVKKSMSEGKTGELRLSWH